MNTHRGHFHIKLLYILLKKLLGPEFQQAIEWNARATSTLYCLRKFCEARHMMDKSLMTSLFSIQRTEINASNLFIHKYQPLSELDGVPSPFMGPWKRQRTLY